MKEGNAKTHHPEGLVPTKKRKREMNETTAVFLVTIQLNAGKRQNGSNS